jgi:hypothetical protein
MLATGSWMKTMVLGAAPFADNRPIADMVSSLRLRPWLSRTTDAVIDR